MDELLNKKVLECFCPKQLTSYEIAERAIFLNKQFGISYKEISESLGCVPSTVYYAVRKYGDEIAKKEFEAKLELLKKVELEKM